jgi:manganese/zinc/iron transport system permease protein
MAATPISPAATARFWTEWLDRVALPAAAYGGLSGAIGSFLSPLASRMPGDLRIVLTTTARFLHGVLAQRLAHRRLAAVSNR